AADAIGDVMSEIVRDATGPGAWTKDRAVKFCAQLALLVRFQPWPFEDDLHPLRELVRANRVLMDAAVPTAKPLFDKIVRGGALGETSALDALLRGKAASAYLQKLAD